MIDNSFAIPFRISLNSKQPPILAYRYVDV